MFGMMRAPRTRRYATRTCILAVFAATVIAGGCAGGYVAIVSQLFGEKEGSPLWTGDSVMTLVRSAPQKDASAPRYDVYTYRVSREGEGAIGATIATPEDESYPKIKFRTGALTRGDERAQVVEASSAAESDDVNAGVSAGFLFLANVPMVAERFGDAYVLVSVDIEWGKRYLSARDIHWVDPYRPETTGDETVRFVYATPTRDQARQMMMDAAADLERAGGAVFLVVTDKYGSVDELRESGNSQHRQAFRRYEELVRSFLRRTSK